MGMTILLAGSSGLVGSHVLDRALVDPRIDRVVVLVRKPCGITHAKLVEWRATGVDLLSGLREERVDGVICCLGTTIRKVGGDRSRFIHVDKQLVVGLGRWAKRQAVPAFAVVSAIGADPMSRVFYSRVKGEMEQELCALGIPRTLIFQPSILTGPRKEFRFGERLGIGFMRLLAPLMIGTLARYRPMPADLLAKALIASILIEVPSHGVQRYSFQEIRSLTAG